MKSKSILLALSATTFLTLTAVAADAIRYNSRPSKVNIAGTSTAHDWVIDGQIIGGFMEVPKGVEFDQSKTALPGTTGGKLAAQVEVTIPVTSMNGSWHGMDAPMQDAMNAKDYPTIRFHLVELTAKEPHAAGTPFQFDAKGELSLHGVTNVITMPVSIETVDANKLKIIGRTPLKMTDFKIEPPVKLGLFRTGDEVIISFEWLVARPKTVSP